MRIYECRYVRKDDPGDLLWGYIWRPAIIVDETPNEGDLFMYPSCEIEECMFDKETGRPVYVTRNFCIDPKCAHSDCAPLTLIAEVDSP